MKKLIMCLILVFICLLQSGVFAYEIEENAPTILTGQEVPKLKLWRSTKGVYSKDEDRPALNYPNIDSKKLKWNTVIEYEESWATEKGEKDYIGIRVTRTYLDSSNEAAKERAKIHVLETMLKLGSLTGTPIGDVCWSAYSPPNPRDIINTNPIHIYVLLFVKGKAVVQLTVSRKIHDPDFVENLARIIESRM